MQMTKHNKDCIYRKYDGILLLQQGIYDLTNDLEFTSLIIEDITKITHDIVKLLLESHRHVLKEIEHIHFPQFFIKKHKDNGKIHVVLLTPFNIASDIIIDIKDYTKGKTN